MNKVVLPPLPSHPEPMIMKWSPLELAALRARDLEVAKCVLEAAAKFCDTTLRDAYASKGLSAQMETFLFAACADAAVGIRALEVSHG